MHRILRHVFSLGVASILIMMTLAGCASGVKHSEDKTTTAPAFAEAGKQCSSVTLRLQPAAQLKIADNLKFDQEKLLGTIKRALQARNVIAAGPNPALPTIEVLVTDIRTRSNFSAVMWGFMAGDDHINGEVIVRGPDGRVLQHFSVSASYALGGLAGGQDDVRMGWLYETFAKHVLEELTGAPKAS